MLNIKIACPLNLSLSPNLWQSKDFFLIQMFFKTILPCLEFVTHRKQLSYNFRADISSFDSTGSRYLEKKADYFAERIFNFL